MIPTDQIARHREALPTDTELRALLGTLRARATPLLDQMPPLPRGKALLSQDGGVCSVDGASLRFDPWSPDRHTCPRCGRVETGERHHLHWARAQYLWMAERLVDLAVLAALEEDARAAHQLEALLAACEERYFACENRDNVLGPTRLFFSTYLESLWVTQLIAAAFLAREAGLLSEDRVEGVSRIADEAAGLIAEFNEGMSNRQTWHAAALTAIAAWFGDEDLAQTSVEARTGLLGHLADGFGEDGLWFEGENYHLFALRGLITGLHWARVAGFDLLEDDTLRAHFRAAVLAPSLTALPDLTYPARKDARFGISLAQPAFLELFEVGRAWLGPDEDLDRWLAALYAAPAPVADHYDAWLHDAARGTPSHRNRADLSPLVLVGDAVGHPYPAPPVVPAGGWQGASLLLPTQQLAILRRGDRYLSLECGHAGGGHGHPDCLHLTLHAGGVHWLPDPGAGSYVQDTLRWYRSVSAHNAPAVDGEAPEADDGRCEAFDAQGDWGWVRGRAGEVSRTVVAGPEWIVDLVELSAKGERTLELPWHLQGDVRVDGPSLLASTAGQTLRLVASAGAELAEASGPGLPTQPGERRYWVRRGTGSSLVWVTVLDLTQEPASQVTDVRVADARIEVVTAAGSTNLRLTPTGVTVSSATSQIALGGLRPAGVRPKPLLDHRPSWDAVAHAPHAWAQPALDGSLDGFDIAAPLELFGEHQYRRSETPYDEQFAAQAWVNWDQEALYLAVAITKPDLVLRPEDAPPLRLDNEPDDIHVDGMQVYLQLPDATVRAMVVTPRDDGTLRVRPVTGTAVGGPAEGAWTETEDGYLMTLRVEEPALSTLRQGARLGFDLLINEAHPDRVRRAGQLAWSGGEGWVYLRGDRQDPARFGTLELG
jgi:hypothetical protein